MRTLDRAMAVLEAVTALEHGHASISAVAVQTGLSLATVSRFMREMATARLLTEANGIFELGPRLITLAQPAGRRGALVSVALPFLQRLRDASGETASLHTRAGDQRVCIATIEGVHDVRRVVQIGFSLPIVVGAAGQTFLAFMPEPDRAAIIKAVPARQRAQLRTRVDQIRRAGYATASDGSAIRGISGIAAPVLEHDVLVAVVSVSGPSFRWTAEAMVKFAPTLLRANAELSARLAGSRATGQPIANGRKTRNGR